MENSSNSTTNDKEVLRKQTDYPLKKFKNYLFDFFMLFLAVTLGFFVNNLSEDRSDRQREKQYMNSLINDLKSDTTQIQDVCISIKNQIVGIDSLLHVMENPDQHNFVNRFYYFALKYLNSATFYSGSDRTISQLKSSGGLRLIQKIFISDSIVNYYSSSDNVKYNTEFCLKEFNKILESEKEMMYLKYLRVYKIDSIPHLEELELLINDPDIINQFYNQVIYYLSSLINYNILLTDLKEEADTLMKLIKESYNLKDASE
ncbi:MAG TPA: hypothetical protein DEO60_06065 [Bacteroidales bacterium]|nr:hypothetical protein [Bacteroidales bacterium]HBZ20672.1 hypothetical protein [Bacteroidales bacterium]